MAWNPGVQSNAGEIFARSMMQAGQAVAAGIERYQQRKREKEQEDAFVKWAKPKAEEFGVQLSGDDVEDDKAIRAGYKSLGPQGMMAFQQAREQAARQAKQDEINQEFAASRQRNLDQENAAAAARMEEVAGINRRADQNLSMMDRFATARPGQMQTGPMAMMQGAPEGRGNPGPRAADGVPSLMSEGNLAGVGVYRPEAVQRAAEFSQSPLAELRRSGVRIMPEDIRAMMKPTKPAGPGSPMGKLIEDHNRAVREGRREDAAFIRAAIEKDITPTGTTLEVGNDGSIRFAQGAQGLTTASASRAQERQRNAERVIKEGAALLARLRPQDVGARGVVQENFVNKALAQINPKLADQELTEIRTQLRMFREGALKMISDDTKFSIPDRKAIERLLPEDGVFESLPSAQGKLIAVIDVMQKRAIDEAGRVGAKTYMELSPEEMREAVGRGELTEEVAFELIRALHPDFNPEEKGSK